MTATHWHSRRQSGVATAWGGRRGRDRSWATIDHGIEVQLVR